MPKKNKEKTLAKQILEQYNVKSLQDIQEVVKELTKGMIQESLNAELDEHLGYEKWDQNSRNISDNYRNGTSQKKVIGSSGEIEIEVPRDSEGSFEPQFVKKYQKDISDIERKIIYMYSKGNSTRDIHDQMNEIYGIDVNKDLVTRVTDKIIPSIQAWQQRPLEKIYTFLFIDGIRFKVKDNGVYVEKSIYIVLGVNTEGFKDILGFWIDESESAKYWLTIFNELKNRGVEDVLIAASDNLSGISQAIKAAFPRTMIQKCIVHQIRNATKFVKYNHLKEFVADMKLIYKSNSLDEAKTNFEKFESKWEKNYSYAVKSWRNNFDELTTFIALPKEIKKFIYTTNVIENVNRCIRKVTKTKGGFTDERSLIKIVYLSLQDIIKKWTLPIRDWAMIINQLDILFENRLNL